MKFRDLLEGKQSASDVCPVCGQTPCNCTGISESEMKYQALAKAKEIHTALATISFIEMMSLMATDNPAKKEVQVLETKLNDLTAEIGEFIQKYIPDVADADPGDTEEYAEPEGDDTDKKVSESIVKELIIEPNSKFSRPGETAKSYEVLKSHGKSVEQDADVYTVEKPNGFYGVFAIKNNVIIGSSHNNLNSQSEADTLAKQFVKTGTVGIRGWSLGSTIYGKVTTK